MSDSFLRPLFTWRSAIASEFGPENGTTRHVLLTLSLHMNEKGESCFPSIDLLTRETGISRRAVVEHLKVAAASGWIGKRDLRRPNGQGWRRVEYFALIPEKFERTFHAEQRSALYAPALGGAPDALRRGGARSSKGGAPDDAKAVHQAPCSTSLSASITRSDPAPSARGARLDRGWTLPNADRQWALKEQPTWDLAHCLKVADNFRDYWIAVPGQRGLKLDWEATWRTWVRKEGPKTNGVGGKNFAAAWGSSEAAIIAKGREVGLEARAGESIHDFKTRIHTKLAERVSA